MKCVEYFAINDAEKLVMRKQSKKSDDLKINIIDVNIPPFTDKFILFQTIVVSSEVNDIANRNREEG